MDLDELKCPTRQVELGVFVGTGGKAPHHVFDDKFGSGGKLPVDAGNFAIDGSRGSLTGDAAGFVNGKCRIRTTVANPLMFIDPAPATGTGLLSLQTTRFVSLGGFGDCVQSGSGTSPGVATIPPPKGLGSSGAGSVYRPVDDKKPPVRGPGGGTAAKPSPGTGSGGSNTVWQPGADAPRAGCSAMDRLAGNCRGGACFSRCEPVQQRKQRSRLAAADFPTRQRRRYSRGARTVRLWHQRTGSGGESDPSAVVVRLRQQRTRAVRSIPSPAPTRSGPDQNINYGAGPGSGRPSGATINPR